ncbi:MAG: hypothetical protein JNN11_05380 [Candidatus Doudnabacteria bacterium]|nr:hypothetical protein [Candidatus Doudnabacteria bacterium]
MLQIAVVRSPLPSEELPRESPRQTIVTPASARGASQWALVERAYTTMYAKLYRTAHNIRFPPVGIL